MTKSALTSACASADATNAQSSRSDSASSVQTRRRNVQVSEKEKTPSIREFLPPATLEAQRHGGGTIEKKEIKRLVL